MLKDHSYSIFSGFKSIMMQTFNFDLAKETFHGCIIPTITLVSFNIYYLSSFISSLFALMFRYIIIYFSLDVLSTFIEMTPEITCLMYASKQTILESGVRIETYRWGRSLMKPNQFAMPPLAILLTDLASCVPSNDKFEYKLALATAIGFFTE